MALTRHNAEMDGEALSDAYERGVRDTLARLTGPEVVAKAAWVLADRSGLDASDSDAIWEDGWDSDARDMLAAVAAALAPRPEDTRERVVTTDEDGNEYMVLAPREERS